MRDDTLREVLDEARRCGAVAAEVWAEDVVGVCVIAARGRAVSTPLPPVVERWVRVWRADGRSAWGPAREGLEGIVTRASAGAPRPPPVERGASRGGLSIRDRRWEQLTDDDRLDVVTTAERSVRQVGRALTARDFAYEERLRVRRYLNSRGVALDESDTVFTCRGTVDGDGGSRTGASSARSFSSVACVPVGAAIARRVADLAGPPVTRSGPVRLVLPPRAAAGLIDHLARLLDAASSGSFLTRATALDPRLHLQDDGLVPGGLRTRSFDDCGVPPAALVLLREGVPHARYVGPDAATGGRAPTGHVRGGGVCPSNLILRAGVRPLAQVLAGERGPVLLVDDLPTDGIDDASGRFSAPVWGQLWDRGRRVGAVRAQVLEGDLGRSLSEVVEVCSDADRVEHVDAPPLVLDGFALLSAP